MLVKQGSNQVLLEWNIVYLIFLITTLPKSFYITNYDFIGLAILNC